MHHTDYTRNIMFKSVKRSYYCENCNQETYLDFKNKKNCPKCKSNLIPLNCSQEEFQEYSPEEQEIIIVSSLLQERTKNKHLQCAIKNPKLSPEEQIQKIANDVTVIKWSILGFAGICVLIYLFEEFL